MKEFKNPPASIGKSINIDLSTLLLRKNNKNPPWFHTYAPIFTKFNQFFPGPFSTFPESFMDIRWNIFA